ncbi:PREDICTED: uncharacterized protein LOC106323086 [Brassica oleracea var. oleracea]|uniref:uncharacterized protein LOC106323086 n=1 Tax=Brassica oleracea var. oleracea TaxID=109376 RepID=UPI0006A6F8DD|nr:PREDICTED: uncharacterized protein LOC106323086 [Brassica oleracea var. oleracea]
MVVNCFKHHEMYIRLQGLQIALATVLPNAEHRVCSRHVYGIWKKKFGDLDYKPFFWKVAYSYTKGEYKLHMDELLLYDREAYDALLAAEPEHWCQAFFSKTGRSANCNNLSESFNRTIKKARELPFINMLETIRRQAMMRISRRFKRADKYIMQFPQRIAYVLEMNRKNSKDFQIMLVYLATMQFVPSMTFVENQKSMLLTTIKLQCG